MRELLMPIDQTGGAWAPIEFALGLARRSGGRVIAGFHPRLETLPVVDAMGGGAIVLSEQSESRAETARAAEKGLNELIARLASENAEHVSFDADSIGTVYAIGERARVHDATIVSKDERYQDWRLVFETALFEGGRPVFLVPADWHGDSGATIAIGWNGSTETARLIGQSLELMRAAATVHVISVENWMVPGPDGKALASYLRCHGINAVNTDVADNGGPSASILATVSELKVDLLLKGAYTQSRLRQMIFGGATSEIIADATMPVLFAH